MVPGARLAISRSAAKLLSTYCTLAGLELEGNNKPPAGSQGLSGTWDGLSLMLWSRVRASDRLPGR